MNGFINNKTPELTMYSKALIALTKWMAKQEDDQQKDRMKKIKDKEKNENSIDEAAPFTGHSDLALPILNYEKYIKKFCDYIDISLEEFWNVSNRFRGTMWKMKDGDWYNTFWDEINKETPE